MLWKQSMIFNQMAPSCCSSWPHLLIEGTRLSSVIRKTINKTIRKGVNAKPVHNPELRKFSYAMI